VRLRTKRTKTKRPAGVEFRATLDDAVLLSLRLVLPGLGFLYLLAAAIRVVLDTSGSTQLALINAASAAAFFGLWMLLVRSGIRARLAHPLLALTCGVGLVNALLHLYRVAAPWHSTEILLLLVGMGCVFLSRSWLAFSTLAVLGPAGFVVWASRPSLEWPYYALTFLGATVLAFGAQAVRLRAFHTIHVMRLRDAELQDELKKSQERYALALRGTNDGLWDWDLTREEIYYSPRWKRLLGYEEPEIGSSPDEWFKRVHPLDLSTLRGDLDAHLRRQSTQFSNEHRIRHKDGSYRWVLTRGLAVRDERGLAIRLVGSQTDITRLKDVESRLMHDALHDRLTGLPNRTYLLSCLQDAVERQNRDGAFLFAVLFLDLDQFKVINDSLGHHVGDRLLEEVGQRLLSCKAPLGTVARLGGDEFVMLIEDLQDPNDVKKTAMEVQQVLSKPFHIEGHEVFTSASIGIALSIGRYERPEDLIRNADIAMYRAKCSGKGQYERFDWSMHSSAVNLWQRQRDLRHALDRDEFFIHYQPTFSLQSGRITEAEALLRWQRANGELLSPKDFISLAEDMGVIVRMGEWVLRTVCKQNQAWQQAGLPPVRVSVNLSVRQLKQHGFVDSVRRVLAETGLEPRWLEFELTESALMETMDAAPTTLGELAEMGVRLSIDDFGNGSSSLSSLQRSCFDTLKISRAFIADMLHDQRASALVRSMINLAHGLDISVTATGVESRDQLSFLLREGCDKIQGYVASRPVPPERFAELLRADRRLLPGQLAVSAAAGPAETQSPETKPVAVSQQRRTDLEELATALSFTDEHSR
jgi:diguanylate cyclase (GGDEF)-like protein/PAS domain S-box-containing protein